jgi:hypothetical protein
MNEPKKKSSRLTRSEGGARISTGVVGGKYSAPSAKHGGHGPSPDACGCGCDAKVGQGAGLGKTAIE